MNLDFVITSSLLRAIETAILAFKYYSGSIYPMPHIAERGITSDNTTSSISRHKEKMDRNETLKRGFSRVDYRYVESKKGNKFTPNANQSDFNMFLSYFSTIFEEVLEQNGIPLDSDKPVRIGIVLHSKLLRKIFQIKGKRPFNNILIVQAAKYLRKEKVIIPLGKLQSFDDDKLNIHGPRVPFLGISNPYDR